MLNKTVDVSDAGYYGVTRDRILVLLQIEPKRVLEIGCGNGATLSLMRKRGADYLCGFEVNPTAAVHARTVNGVDEVFVEDVETGLHRFDDSSFDLIIASHVLEHLLDPWSVAKQVFRVLRKDGQLLGAIPNVRHMSVLLPLLFKGHWTYQSLGIMDWSHLRFFTKSSIHGLLKSAGFCDIDLHEDIIGKRSKFISQVSGGLLNEFSAYAYNFSARKRAY